MNTLLFKFSVQRFNCSTVSCLGKIFLSFFQ